MLKDQLDVEAQLEVGTPGSFEVRVDGKPVAAKVRFTFPSEEEIVTAVAKALGRDG